MMAEHLRAVMAGGPWECRASSHAAGRAGRGRSTARDAACLIVVALLISTCILPARAETDALVTQAQSLHAQKQFRQSYDLLEPHEPARAGDPDFDLAFGKAANAVGEFSRAIMALERVLTVQPDNAVARAELGRALFGVGDTRGARAALSESRLRGVPIAAGESIDQLLQAVDRVDAEGRSSWKGYAEGGVGVDDNANSGPAQRNFAVPAFGGALVTLAPSAGKTRGAFLSLGVGISGRYVLAPRWSVIGNASGNIRDYRGDARRLDTLQADGNLGLSYRVDRNEYALVAQAGAYDIDRARVRNARGVVAEWTHRIDGFRQFGSYLQVGRMTYPTQRIAGVDRRVLGTSYAHLTPSGLLAFGGVYVGREDERAAQVPHLGHRLAGARAGVQVPLATDLAAFATAGFERRRFGGPDPLFLVRRRDEQAQASLGASWVVGGVWRITPQVSWLQTRSNVDLAAYDRTTASVTVRREF